MLNIYAPNVDNPDFFRKPFAMIPASSSNVIIGGDFNCYLDLILDRLSTKLARTIASVQTVNDLSKTRMVDIWQHPTKMLPLLEETFRSSLLQSDYNKILKLKY